MRLLRIEDDGSFGLVEHFGYNIPPYAILSHTWGADEDEVSFKDLVQGKGKKKAGFRKLIYCAQQAVQDGMRFFWADTCCIDKSSSAELSEAINSMFKWYLDSQICYAYLGDVDYTEDFTQIAKARWFTRGWTLQELIAPKTMVFYSKDWKELGNKSRLSKQIAQITGIDPTVLDRRLGYDLNLRNLSVARRMSWASQRNSTRIEDEAYCLLGIFGVNMPLLYGEGRQAFARLQEEIMKESADHSLFAWRPDPNAASGTTFGAFAPSAAAFAHSSHVVPFGTRKRPYHLTNQGLQIQLPLLPQNTQGDGKTKTFTGVLDCARLGDKFGFIGIGLEALDERNKVFGRTRESLSGISSRQLRNAEVKDIYITKRSLAESTTPIEKKFVLTRRSPPKTYPLRFEGIFTTDWYWEEARENQLIDLSLVKISGDATTPIFVGRMALLYTCGQTSYAVVFETEYPGVRMPGQTGHDDLGMSNLGKIDIYTMPTGLKSPFLEEQIRILLTTSDLQKHQSYSRVEIPGLGYMHATITFDCIGEQELWILDIDVSEASKQGRTQGLGSSEKKGRERYERRS
ncbi:HET-domain-containing protein [Lophiostoma macrostomum CBS 122681]|uniref:HET-domain-containing protein n=1 Tax=Lophiostoma macrostomum CBS 122681 TaxID=1314788 RepID=A0A6A6T8D3_9PLEO|nr:HET-domain-containing protein [Lophiostoma macrostomum CBS 122681]